MEIPPKMAQVTRIHESTQHEWKFLFWNNVKKMRDSGEASCAPLCVRFSFLFHFIRIIIISSNSSFPAALHIRQT